MSADNYKYIQADELRELCAFKDRTIEILQDALSGAKDEEVTSRHHKYCAVRFPNGGRLYTYLTGGLEYKPGDCVIVPVGRNHNEELATVKSVHNTAPTDGLVYKTIHRKA